VYWGLLIHIRPVTLADVTAIRAVGVAAWYYAELSPVEHFASQAVRAQKIFGFVQQHFTEI